MESTERKVNVFIGCVILNHRYAATTSFIIKYKDPEKEQKIIAPVVNLLGSAKEVRKQAYAIIDKAIDSSYKKEENEVVGGVVNKDIIKQMLDDQGTPERFLINPISFGSFCMEMGDFFDPTTKYEELDQKAGFMFGKPVVFNNIVALNKIMFEY